MTEYYKNKLQQGLEYQDFIACEFAKIGIPLTSFSSKKYQYQKGENLQGYEIKNDQKFRQTGNLWIEIAEKKEASHKVWYDSGIKRSDNTIFYVIGDYKGAFIMQKSILSAFADKGRYKIRVNNNQTSKGFLLPVKDAEYYFNYRVFSTTK